MTDDAPSPQTRSAPEIRILGGEPTAQEIAAVTAVLSAALDQLADREQRAEVGESAWDRSARGLRPGLGRGDWPRYGA